MPEGQLLEAPKAVPCHIPHCTKPRVGVVRRRYWPMCGEHAISYAEMKLAEAQKEYDDLKEVTGHGQVGR